jgi:hypothetical protein
MKEDDILLFLTELISQQAEAIGTEKTQKVLAPLDCIVVDSNFKVLKIKTSLLDVLFRVVMRMQLTQLYFKTRLPEIQTMVEMF